MARTVALDTAIEEYLEHLRIRGLAPGTIRTRRSALYKMIDTIGRIQVSSVLPDHIDRYFARWSLSQSTTNTRISMLRNFFAFCRARGYMPRDRDPMYGWRTRAPAEVERTRIPRAEWPRIFSVCESSTERVVIGLGLYLFLRASEQKSIQIKHLRLSESLVEVYRPKTRQWDTMPIVAELDPIIREQIEWIASQHPIDPDFYLVPSGTGPQDRAPDGRLLARSGEIIPTRPYEALHRIVQRVLTRAGYPIYWEGGHTLRRSGARAYFDFLVEEGYDGALRRVQSMLGHRNSIMTEVYLGLDIDRQRRNDDLRGNRMFPLPENVIEIRRPAHGRAD